MVLELIIISTVIVSLASLAGIMLMNVSESRAKQILFLLVSFSAGTLLGTAFLDLLPEALEGADAHTAFIAALAGIMIFFMLEKVIHWHHHHDPHRKHGIQRPKPLGYLNLVGDGLHNFFDGTAIAASFMAGTPVGLATTLAVLLHEIPQEIGDYSLLIYSGFSKGRALLFNLISAIFAVIGGILFFYFSSLFEGIVPIALGFTAGMFIYIASTDLVPELHKETDPAKSLMQLSLICLGISAIWIVATFLEGH
ncbi:MAG TPA: ZIP family metal transporter [Candidatus Norongarragalinales archaeon]|nr:ZIP family metal transporter [Candidatus Norongarragalinales archaeon]